MQSDCKPVDLNLAQTYVPGFVVFFKSGFLIVLVAQTGAMSALPLLLMLSSLLYLDRVCRQECIFDSNSLLCALYASYVIDSIRLLHGDGLLLHVLSNDSLVGWAALLEWVLIVSCCCQTLDLSFMTAHGGHVRTGFMVVQLCLFSLVSQVRLDEEQLEAGSVMFRSGSFVVLSIVWTYVVGVPNMVELLNCTSRLSASTFVGSKSGRKGTQTVLVQSFTPCLLRFGAVLILTGWSQTVCIVTLTISLAWRFFCRHPKSRGGEGTCPEPPHPEYCMPPSSVEGMSNFRDSCRDFVSSPVPSVYVQQQVVGDTNMGIKNMPLYFSEDSVSAAGSRKGWSHNEDVENVGVVAAPFQSDYVTEDQSMHDDDSVTYNMFQQAKQSMGVADQRGF